MKIFHRSGYRTLARNIAPIICTVSALAGCLDNDVVSSLSYHPVDARLSAPAVVDMRNLNSQVQLSIFDQDEGEEFHVIVTLNADTLRDYRTPQNRIQIGSWVWDGLRDIYSDGMDSVVLAASVKDRLGHQDIDRVQIEVTDTRAPDVEPIPPEPPTIVHPVDQTLLVEVDGSARIRFDFERTESSHYIGLEVALDPEFGQIVNKHENSRDSFDLGFEIGDYYLRAQTFFVVKGDTVRSEWTAPQRLRVLANDVPPDLSDILYLIRMVPDGVGGIYVSGNAGLGGTVRRVDAQLNPVWSRSLPPGETLNEHPTDMVLADDGDLLVVSHKDYYPARRRAWISRWSPTGDLRWYVPVVPDVDSDSSRPISVARDLDGGAWVGTSSKHIVRVSADSLRTPPDPAPTALYELVHDPTDGTFVYAGIYEGSVIVGRLDQSASRVWSRGIHSLGSFSNTLLQLRIRQDGTILVAAGVGSGVLVTALQNDGALIWQEFISAQALGEGSLGNTDLVVLPSGDFYLIGMVNWDISDVECAAWAARFDAGGQRAWIRFIAATHNLTAWRGCMRGEDLLVSAFASHSCATSSDYAQAPVYFQLDPNGNPVPVISAPGRRSR